MSAVQSTSSRLEKRRILVDYIRSLTGASLPLAVTYLTGRPFSRADGRRLSIGGSSLSTALLAALPDSTLADLNAAWLRHSDAGDTAADLWQEFSPELLPISIEDMKSTFELLFEAKGPTGKIPILVDALRRMGSNEIRAFVKIMLGETRVGVQEGTIEDAVAHAFELPLAEVRAANRHRADIGAVALEASKGELEASGFAYFNPVDPMLAHPTEGPDEVIRRLGTPVWVEDKYDGVRCQLHKRGPDVRLYSRDRKDITRQFPDVVAAFSSTRGDYALDGELMALKDGKSLPFARLQQRLNRVAPSREIIEAHPAALVAFDIIATGDESLLDAPLRDRRVRLDALALPLGQYLAQLFTAESSRELDRLFDEAQQVRGNEGLMCKDPDSPYASGRRGYQWLKLKRPLDTLDVVIVGAEWGHGKRRNVLSDYTFAVIDDREGASKANAPPSEHFQNEDITHHSPLTTHPLVNIGKAYGGLTDAEIAEMTERLKTITIRDLGRYRSVEPQIVLEVEFNGIQQSTRHKSGYALRFPRIVRIRDDKRPAEINTLSDVARMYSLLAGETR